MAEKLLVSLDFKWKKSPKKCQKIESESPIFYDFFLLIIVLQRCYLLGCHWVIQRFYVFYFFTFSFINFTI
jgi:hypothetical protein